MAWCVAMQVAWLAGGARCALKLDDVSARLGGEQVALYALVRGEILNDFDRRRPARRPERGRVRGGAVAVTAPPLLLLLQIRRRRYGFKVCGRDPLEG